MYRGVPGLSPGEPHMTSVCSDEKLPIDTKTLSSLGQTGTSLVKSFVPDLVSFSVWFLVVLVVSGSFS